VLVAVMALVAMVTISEASSDQSSTTDSPATSAMSSIILLDVHFRVMGFVMVAHVGLCWSDGTQIGEVFTMVRHWYLDDWIGLVWIGLDWIGLVDW
jgi:hypothetical protein